MNRIRVTASHTLLGAGRLEAGLPVLVDGNRIVAVGDEALAGEALDIRLPGHVLMPGLINLHTHAAAGPLSRGVAEDYPLAAGMPFYVPMAELYALGNDPEFTQQRRELIRWDLLTALRTGTTTVLDHASTDPVGHLDAALAVGIRAWSGPSLPSDVRHRLGGLDARGAEQRTERAGGSVQREELARLHALFDAYDGRGEDRIRLTCGPGGAHTTELDVIRGAADFARDVDRPLTTHLCQAASELRVTHERYGKTPLEVLVACGYDDINVIAAHGTYLPEVDFPLAARMPLTIAHCPSRKAKEAVTSPLVEFADAGIGVGLGSDAFTVDMFSELRTAAMLGKMRAGGTTRPTSPEILAMATAVNARALGRTDLGTLDPGSLADMIAVDIDAAVGGPSYHDIEQHLVHYTSGYDVSFSMVSGRIVMSERELVGIDWRAEADRARRAADTIWSAAAERGILPLPMKKG